MQNGGSVAVLCLSAAKRGGKVIASAENDGVFRVFFAYGILFRRRFPYGILYGGGDADDGSGVFHNRGSIPFFHRTKNDVLYEQTHLSPRTAPLCIEIVSAEKKRHT